MVGLVEGSGCDCCLKWQWPVGALPAKWCPVVLGALVISRRRSGAIAACLRDVATRSRAGAQGDVRRTGHRKNSSRSASPAVDACAGRPWPSFTGGDVPGDAATQRAPARSAQIQGHIALCRKDSAATARAHVASRRSWRSMQSQPVGRLDRQGRFHRREGHDLERLLWPGTGSGDNTGLLQN